MKKIGLLISQMNSGGAERVVSRLSYILSKEYLVHIIVFEDTFMDYNYSGTLINMDLKATARLHSKVSLLLKRIISLRKIKREYNLDIVISFLDSPNIVNILSKTKNCKTGVSVRNYSAFENSKSIITKLTNILIKFLYNQADKIIPVSKVIANSYIKDYKIKENKIKVIYNPYDINQINELSNLDLEPEYENFINKGKTFVSVGRHVYQKGFWHLIKAFKLVHNQHHDAKLIIVGKDYENGKVQKLVNDLGLHENVLITGQQRNPFKFIKNSDIYIMSSLFEGFPNSLVEAMACSRPVIATDCKSGPREILNENPNLLDICKDITFCNYGILVPPLGKQENWDANKFEKEEFTLSEAMILLLNDSQKVDYYSEKSFERAKTFNYEKCLAEFKNVIENV